MIPYPASTALTLIFNSSPHTVGPCPKIEILIVQAQELVLKNWCHCTLWDAVCVKIKLGTKNLFYVSNRYML